MSLSSELVPGNNLTEMLLRFREHRPRAGCFVADIKMFYQIRVPPSDSDALSFLCWQDGDLDKEASEFTMRKHIFGASDSPSCASFALQKTANDNTADFIEAVANVLLRDFYVDDLLKSVNTLQETTQFAAELQSLLRRGGFNLTKWSRSHPQLTMYSSGNR